MKNNLLNRCIALLLIFFIFFGFCGCLQEVNQKEEGNVFYVGKTKGEKYNTIQEAIDLCEENALIYVLNGYYVENIIIHKPVKLIGENPKKIIIDGGFQNNVVEIISDDVYITNITFQNSNISTDYLDMISGIYIKSNNVTVENCVFQNNMIGIQSIANNNTIYNCFFQNNSYGFYSVDAKNNNVTNSTFLSNSKYGIYLYIGSELNLISENRFYNNSCGGRIRAENNSIFRNVFENNLKGLYVCCDSNNINIYHNDFINNLIYHGKGNYHNNIWYYDNQTGGNYWNDYHGEDNNCDGIGDLPYQILSREVNGTLEVIEDLYPLMKPIIN